MNVYSTDKIRNVALLGHGGVGKTTIAEAMLFASGAINRQGKVADGNTVSDFDAEETKRKFSINTSLIPVEWDGFKLNILDTPGYFDFVGEVQEALHAADAALIVVNGKSGVEVGTELAWERAGELGLPRMIFVNGMDDPEANLNKVLDQLKEKFGPCVAPVQVPMREGGKYIGFVNVPKMEGRKFEGNKVVTVPIPAGMEDQIKPVRSELLEAVAGTDDALMERFFETDGEDFTPEEISKALHQGCMAGAIVPVLCGCATMGIGIPVLMNSITGYFPAPNVLHPTHKAEEGEIKCDDAEKVSAFVFKTSNDPFLGKINYYKVYSGILKADSLTNCTKEADERIAKVATMRGKDQVEVAELHAGDIGAAVKLAVTGTNHTLAAKGFEVHYAPVKFDEPMLVMAIAPQNKGDEDKVSQGLTKIMDEDKTVKMVVDSEMKQQLIYGVGEQHMDIISSKLANKFKINIVLSKPKVSYRESIRDTITVQGKHKKQSGGHGQYGDVHIRFEPSGDMSTPYVFAEEVFGGSVPKQYFPAVEKGIQECVQNGVLAGCPMVGLKATLTDGSYHPVDSNEMSFKLATAIAFKEGIPKAKPVIMEPIMLAHVLVNENYVGDVMGDMNKRRGRVLGMDPAGNHKTMLNVEVPMAEMFSYPTDLRAMTQGRGRYTMEFVRYEDTPRDVQQKIMDEAKKNMEEEA